jgi:hypothetical protein
MTKALELYAKADRFALRAAHARTRTERNTYLSLEKSYRTLAAKQERFEAAGRRLDGVIPARAANG